MNVYVMGRRVLQWRNLALSRVRLRKPWVIHTVTNHRFIIYIFILKCMFIFYVKDYEANQQLETSHLLLQAPHGNVVVKFNMAYAKNFKTNGSVVVTIKIIKMSCFKYISYPDWRGALRRHSKQMQWYSGQENNISGAVDGVWVKTCRLANNTVSVLFSCFWSSYCGHIMYSHLRKLREDCMRETPWCNCLKLTCKSEVISK